MDLEKFYDEIDVVDLPLDAKRKVKVMLKFIESKNIKITSMLDIGTIPEVTELFTKTLGCEATGINISKKVLDHYQPKNVKLVHGDIMEIELDGKYDFILCQDVIEHIFNVDKFIEKVHSLLKPGGYVALTTPNLASLFNRVSLLFGFQPFSINPSRTVQFNPMITYDFFNGHVSPFTYSAFKKFMEKNGFKIYLTKGYYGGHPGENKIRVLLRRLISKYPPFAEGVVLIAKKL